MDMPATKLTRQQLEQIFSQRIQQLYHSRVGHQPDRVSCQLFDNKLAIVLENAISRPVQLLAENDRSNLAQQVRLNVDAALKPELVQIVEDVLGVEALDLLTDTSIETGRTGIIAVLAVAPTDRDTTFVPPVKLETVSADGDR
ncbi:DUF2294 domain-containing protein [Planktothrix sp. FACHB-1355]|uniref:DUF2294 domain-containing protein n=1 Tax=Aerosakkonema funiforme FACHB-1375 TaxID=2949571 RepID=A0A926VIA4_9CYAN|nr:MULTISPECIES: DUF2294 domain-containing protein [Oscillatoriales]MBD2184288.1 DUF2294 domain-containing protein [Aerosakkonema funiforme FACHB-1375]MBD3558924.1 DUF2294 domain-containing protein [Planktothrix sp. FACHB-1355]